MNPTRFAPGKPRDVTTKSGSVCALCKPSGLRPAWLERRSIRDELGGVGARLCVFPFSVPHPRPLHRSLCINVLQLEGRRFSAPGGCGPSLEACGAPFRKLELIATCSPRASPSFPNSLPQAVILHAVRYTSAGVQDDSMTFLRTPPRLGEGVTEAVPRPAGCVSIP